MTSFSDDMRDARYQLQLLSASDPAVRANMLRHVAAVGLLIGRRGIGGQDDQTLIGSSFELVEDEDRIIGNITREDGLERVHLTFDVDDAAGPPTNLSIFRREGDHVVRYPECVLWAPPSEGRAVIVPTADGHHSRHFAFRRGKALKTVWRQVPGDLEAGVRRANARLYQLIRSAELRDAGSRGFANMIYNVGQNILVKPLPKPA